MPPASTPTKHQASALRLYRYSPSPQHDENDDDDDNVRAVMSTTATASAATTTAMTTAKLRRHSSSSQQPQHFDKKHAEDDDNDLQSVNLLSEEAQPPFAASWNSASASTIAASRLTESSHNNETRMTTMMTTTTTTALPSPATQTLNHLSQPIGGSGDYHMDLLWKATQQSPQPSPLKITPHHHWSRLQSQQQQSSTAVISSQQQQQDSSSGEWSEMEYSVVKTLAAAARQRFEQAQNFSLQQQQQQQQKRRPRKGLLDLDSDDDTDHDGKNDENVQNKDRALMESTTAVVQRRLDSLLRKRGNSSMIPLKTTASGKKRSRTPPPSSSSAGSFNAAFSANSSSKPSISKKKFKTRPQAVQQYCRSSKRQKLLHTYTSVRQAAAATNIARRILYQALQSGEPDMQEGFVWKFVNQEQAEASAMVANAQRMAESSMSETEMSCTAAAAVKTPATTTKSTSTSSTTSNKSRTAAAKTTPATSSKITSSGTGKSRAVTKSTSNASSKSKAAPTKPSKTVAVASAAKPTSKPPLPMRNNKSSAAAVAAPALQSSQATVSTSATRASTSSRPAHKSQPVQQFRPNDNKLVATHQSIRKASQKTGISRHLIHACLRGERSMAGGFKWKYALQHDEDDTDDDDDDDENDKKKDGKDENQDRDNGSKGKRRRRDTHDDEEENEKEGSPSSKTTRSRKSKTKGTHRAALGPVDDDSSISTVETVHAEADTTTAVDAAGDVWIIQTTIGTDKGAGEQGQVVVGEATTMPNSNNVPDVAASSTTKNVNGEVTSSSRAPQSDSKQVETSLNVGEPSTMPHSMNTSGVTASATKHANGEVTSSSRVPQSDSKQVEASLKNVQGDSFSSSDNESTVALYELDGIAYKTYTEMVEAKRLRNQQKLEATGLLHKKENKKMAAPKKKESKKRPADDTAGQQRKSRRIVAGTDGSTHSIPLGNGIELFTSTILQTGALGVTIVHKEIPTPIRTAIAIFLQNKQHSSIQLSSLERGCLVESMEATSLCNEVGIRTGDWLVLQEESVGGKEVFHVQYSSIRNRARQGLRPLQFWVFRPPQDNVDKKRSNASASKASESVMVGHGVAGKEETQGDRNSGGCESARKDSAHPVNIKGTTSVDDQEKSCAPPVSSANQGGGGSSKEVKPNEKEILPFCAMCNGRAKRPIHHAWCPHNPQFEDSGANEVLERIQQGMALGCSVCSLEYSCGRMQKNATHTVACERNQERLLNATIEDEKEESPENSQTANKNRSKLQESSRKSKSSPARKESKNPRAQHEKKSKKDETQPKAQGRRKSHESKKLDTPAIQPSGKRKDNRFLSDSYKKNRRSHESTENSRKDVSNGKSAQAASRKALTVSSKEPSQAKKSTGETSRQKSKKSQKSGDSLANGTKKLSSIELDDVPSLMDTSESEIDDDSIGKLEICWEDCRDPWGGEGYRDEDIVVFTTAPGIGEADTLFPSQRFEKDPFSKSDQYVKTHHTPAEGLQALVLKRDPTETTPWGFTCRRHEFGGACLVSSVVPLSPADTAVFLAASATGNLDASLRKNDMILAANGKPVGGMTEGALEVLLETVGSELVLLVSRHKHAEQEDHQDRVDERRFLSVIDSSINNDRRLDWADIGVLPTDGIALVPKTTIAVNSDDPLETETPIRTGCDKGFDLNEKTPCTENFRSSKAGESESSEPVAQTTRHIPSENPPNEDTCCDAEEPLKGKGITPDHHELDESSVESSEDEVTLNPVGKHGQVTKGQSQAGCHLDACRSKEEPKCDNSKEKVRKQQRNGSDNSEEEWEDDGNAWCACVCGDNHLDKDDVFWIQCELCDSWYNVFSSCVGFGKDEAADIERWICWGCEETEGSCSKVDAVAKPESPPKEAIQVLPSGPDDRIQNSKTTDVDCGADRNASELLNVNAEKEKMTIKKTFKRPVGRAPTGKQWDMETGTWVSIETNDEAPKLGKSSPTPKPKQEACVPPKSSGNEKSCGSKNNDGVVYSVGSLVYIREHAWPGVNNSEGTAKVLKVYKDEDGDLVYDVKYVVGGSKAKGVLSEFVSENIFL